MTLFICVLEAESVSGPYSIIKFHSKLKIQDGRHKKKKIRKFAKFHYHETKDHIIPLLIDYLDRVPIIHIKYIQECFLESKIQNDCHPE